MFDIGFWELLLIAVIGLVVLGPERLPIAIRAFRSWISNIRRFSDSVKKELSEELRIQELHNHLKEAEQSNMQDLSPEVAKSVKSLQEATKMVNNPFQVTKSDENTVTKPSPISDENENNVNENRQK